MTDRPTGHVEIAHDGFAGDIIGYYTTREGKPGVVVQQDGTRVVHVYGEKWLRPSLQKAQCGGFSPPSGEAAMTDVHYADIAPPVSNWVGWRSIDTAPEDQHVILCTSGGHVGEAIMLIDEDTGQQKWAWALGPVHPSHTPYGWQPLPAALNAPVASDLRPCGFDGPTGAE